MRPGEHAIYALVDPRDELVRYIGYTSRQLETRLAVHLSRPVNKRMRAWFADLARAGLGPSIRRIASTTAKRWERDEMQWIAWARSFGQLLNVDPGGDYRERQNGKLRVRRSRRRLARKIRRDIQHTCDRSGSEGEDDPAT